MPSTVVIVKRLGVKLALPLSGGNHNVLHHIWPVFPINRAKNLGRRHR